MYIYGSRAAACIHACMHARALYTIHTRGTQFFSGGTDDTAADYARGHACMHPAYVGIDFACARPPLAPTVAAVVVWVRKASMAMMYITYKFTRLEHESPLSGVPDVDGELHMDPPERARSTHASAAR